MPTSPNEKVEQSPPTDELDDEILDDIWDEIGSEEKDKNIERDE